MKDGCPWGCDPYPCDLCARPATKGEDNAVLLLAVVIVIASVLAALVS